MPISDHNPWVLCLRFQVTSLRWADRTLVRLGLPRGDLPILVEEAAERCDRRQKKQWEAKAGEASLQLARSEGELAALYTPEDSHSNAIRIRNKERRTARAERIREAASLEFVRAQWLLTMLRSRQADRDLRRESRRCRARSPSLSSRHGSRSGNAPPEEKEAERGAIGSNSSQLIEAFDLNAPEVPCSAGDATPSGPTYDSGNLGCQCPQSAGTRRSV